jgi:hypothetical protein
LLFDVIDLSQRDEGTGQAVRLSSRPVEQKSASIVIHGSWKPLAREFTPGRGVLLLPQ